MRPASSSAPSLSLVCGEDEFAVKQRARQLFNEWIGQSSSLDQEIIDASASNSSEALQALRKVREALDTFPLFGGTKIVWFQNCNFLGEDRTAQAQAVTEAVNSLADYLKNSRWENLRLLISAGKVDRRRVFFKTIERLGTVETFAGWSADDRDWAAQAEETALGQLRALGKAIDSETVSKLVALVGPNSRQLHNEIEKLALYSGPRSQLVAEDIDAIVTRTRQSRAFELGEAVGARDLPRALRALDEELWEMKTSSQKSEIGLLYGLISKIRALLFLKEMIRQGWVKPDVDFGRFRAQLAKVPAESLPEDKKLSPLAMNPYILYKAAGQAKNYAAVELIRAMEILLGCNERLIFSSIDPSLVLQQTIIEIITRRDAELAGAKK